MTAAARWNRLAARLREVDVPATVTERPYTESERGRIVHGVSRSIIILVPDRGTVEIRDQLDRGDRWLGWLVDRCDPDGIIQWSSHLHQNHTDVVELVADQHALLTKEQHS